MFNKDNILEARFSNADYDTISVLYTDENGNLIETYVQVNEEDVAYKALVEAGHSKEVIEEKTVEYKKAYMSNVYNTLKERHPGTHKEVITAIENEIEAKKEELASVQEQVEMKREEFLTAIAAIKALNDKHNITSET